MSTALLYHSFGIRGYRPVRTQHEGGQTIFSIRQEDGELRCPRCQGRELIRRGTLVRRFRTLPIGGKKVLKGTRWLPLKNPENLDAAKNERERLEEAPRLNQPRATAYYLKEDLRRFWEQSDQAAAQEFLKDWIARAEASGITILKRLARTIHLFQFGLMAGYDHPISTGPLEGTHNKIKTLQRQAYGHRDQEYFRLRIYALHEAKYALGG